MVTTRGGTGIWTQVDHTEPHQVRRLFERVAEEQEGRLDILVNDISGDSHLDPEMQSGKTFRAFWEYPLEKGLLARQQGVHSHIIASYYAAPLMVARRQGLIVEVNDGNYIGHNSCGLYYSLTKSSAVLLAYFQSKELKKYNIAVVALTPGYLRSEAMLERKGVTEDSWRDAIERDSIFANSETPFYIGRAVVALASDPHVMDKTGRALSAGWLARDYGFTDIDGTQPPGCFKKEGVFTGVEFRLETGE